jgi:hypothetical protein
LNENSAPAATPGRISGSVTVKNATGPLAPSTRAALSIFLLGAGQMTLPVKIFTAIEYGVDPSVAAISTMLIVFTGLGLAAAERWVGFHRFV